MTTCPDDFLYRRRLGALDANDEALLQTHLRFCAPCTAEAGIAAAFEAVGGPRPGDALLLARAAAGAQRGRMRRPRRPLPWMAAAAGFALVLAGLASAGFGLYRRTNPPAKQPTTSAGAASSARQALPASAATPAAPVAPADPGMAAAPPQTGPTVAPPAPVSGLSTTGARARPSRLRATASIGEPRASLESGVSLPDLKTLFAAANEARRAGHRSEAGALYTELQRRFPDSRETRLSFVSFGRMLLDGGETARALQQFDRYRMLAPADVLAAEASYGRARALTALHRDAEAHQAWAELLARFPDSIYADVARRQLHKVPNGPN